MSARLKPGPRPVPGIVRTASGRPSRSREAGEISAAYSRWARTAVQRGNEVRAAIRTELGERRAALAWRAVQVVVVDDRDAPELTADLRVALAAVHALIISAGQR